MRLVSIIIPTFNRRDELARAISSVLEQTYQNYEIIIIDNHSTDNTFSMVQSFLSDKIFLYQINNQGIIGRSRNEGIRRARGAYFAFLDSDDWWEKDKLKLSVESLEKNNADFLYHNFTECHSGYEAKKNVKDISLHPSHLLKRQGNPICTSTVLLRRTNIPFLFSEDPKKAGWEDYELWMRVADQGLKFIKLDNYLSFISKNDNNFSNSDQTLKNLMAIDNHLKSNNLPWISYARGKIYKEQGNKNIARENFFEVLFSKHCPLNLRIKSILMILKTFT